MSIKHFMRAPLPAAILLALSVPAVAASVAETDSATDIKAVTLGTVTVSASADASAQGLQPAYAGGQVARGARIGILGSQDTMDTPFNITSYTYDLIQDQQARSVSDVMQNDPGVRVARGFGNFQELYVVRGFPLYSDDIAYNGLYGMLPRQYVAAELLERVEIFRGANTFLNGAAPGGSGVGGAINLAPKRAPNEALTQITAGIESGGQTYVATDLARRFGPDKAFGVRFNAVSRNGDTAVHDEKRNLSAFALGLDYHADSLRVSADIGYQDHTLNAPRPSVTPAAGGVPIAPSSNANFAQPWTSSEESDTFGTLRAEYDINSNVTAWAAVGMRSGTERNVLGSVALSNNATGAGSGNRFDNVRDDSVTTAETGIRGKFNTGSVGHTVTLSAAVYRQDIANAYAFYATPFSTNIYSPTAQPLTTGAYYPGGGLLAHPQRTEQVQTSSVALADTVSLWHDRLLVTAGVRQQGIKDTSFDYTTGVQNGTPYDKSKLSPVAGLVFKLNKQFSIYGNYIESLVKGDVASGTYVSGGATLPITNAGQVFAPYQSKQREVGVKYDGGKFGGSLAAFSTTKPSAYIVGSSYQVAGEQRNQGVELTAFGAPTKQTRLLGGVTLLDAEQVRTNTPANDGKDAIGVPKAQANVGGEWDVPHLSGLTLTGRVLYTASQYVDAANTAQVKPWSRLDLGARYVTEIGKQMVTWRARIDNVTDKNYWASVGGYPGSNYLVLGAPRTLAVSATVDF